MRLWPLALALVTACGATPGASEETQNARGGGGAESGDHDEVRTLPDEPSGRAPGACPAAYGETGPSCSGSDIPRGCTYPQGACECSSPVWCGGAAPPPMPFAWTCSAPTPPCPEPGTPCTPPGHCSTDPCGFDGVSCIDGVWSPVISPRPP